MTRLSSIFTVTNFATAITVFYLYVSIQGIVNLMYPLRKVDVSSYPPQQLVRSYWYPTKQQSEPSKTKTDQYHLSMKVYLSSNPEFHTDFLIDEFNAKDEFLKSEINRPSSQADGRRIKRTKHDTILLWEQPTMKDFTSMSRNIIITTDREGSSSSASMLYALDWLQDAQRKADALSGSKSGVLQALSTTSAGQGIASTSILLTLYHSASSSIRSLVRWVTHSDSSVTSNTTIQDSPSVFHVASSSSIWKAVMNNSTVYLHVVLTRHEAEIFYLPQIAVSYNDELQSLQQAADVYNMLLGKVNMIKHDIPHHIPKPTRTLYHDLVYLAQKYCIPNFLQKTNHSWSQPPWIMSYSKPNEFNAYQRSKHMKKIHMGYPYWKPEVTIQMISDRESYPQENVHLSGMEVIQVNKRKVKHGNQFESGLAYLPGLYVDEIGLTSDKYIPLNASSTALPLRITFQRNVVSSKDEGTKSVEGSGMSPARWRLLRHLSDSLEQQKQFGFEQSDIDDIRRLIAETNVVLLAITVFASTLHLLFEFLTFKSDVEFWRGNTDLTGLSVRALFMDFFSQCIVLLYLIEKDSSLLMTVPSAIGCLIALWKFQRGAGLKFVPVTSRSETSFYNKFFRLFGYELQATRLRNLKNPTETGSKKATSDSSEIIKVHDLAVLTEEMDRLAFQTIGKYFIIPIVILYSFYTLVYQEHTGWYSWFITSASSAVYAVGFVLMTPQLFLNYKLKTVAHLPWNVLFYRFINTFIDDLFSFIIRMPTMYASMFSYFQKSLFLCYLNLFLFRSVFA